MTTKLKRLSASLLRRSSDETNSPVPVIKERGKATILVVDDEHDIRDVLRYNLEHAGFRVITAASGEEALNIAREYMPDLILLDLMLPFTDGLEVCRLLRQIPHTSQIPIIMVTAKNTPADVDAGFDMGADDYITKPFSVRALLARVQARLNESMRST